MKFLLYHHKNKRLAEYVYQYSQITKYVDSSFADCQILALPNENRSNSFSELPESMRKLLFFAKPDLVICMDDGVKPIRPIFAFEVTTHVPARDHWMQRFNNLVGCAEVGVPGAYVMPFDMSRRESFSGEIDPFFFFAYERVMEIHQTPFYIADWVATDGSNLDHDSAFPDMPKHDADSMRTVFRFLNLVIESAVHGRNLSEILRERIIVDLRTSLRKYAYSQIPQISDFERLTYNMSSGCFLTNEKIEEWLLSKGIECPEFPDRIKKRNRNLIFVPQVNKRKKSEDELRKSLLLRIQKKGGDPYLGQPLAFDYIFCRLGPTPYERDANVIIDLSVLYFSDLARYHKEIWEHSPLQYTVISDIPHIPTYTMYLTEGSAQVIKNFLRVYAYTADIIVFKDGVVYF